VQAYQVVKTLHENWLPIGNQNYQVVKTLRENAIAVAIQNYQLSSERAARPLAKFLDNNGNLNYGNLSCGMQLGEGTLTQTLTCVNTESVRNAYENRKI
jgi:hypothetical protein